MDDLTDSPSGVITADTLRSVAKQLLANMAPLLGGAFLFHAHPDMYRDLLYVSRGGPRRKHQRRASARGRKRALMASWRPFSVPPDWLISAEEMGHG